MVEFMIIGVIFKSPNEIKNFIVKDQINNISNQFSEIMNIMQKDNRHFQKKFEEKFNKNQILQIP